jgi:minor histocompatibility antigen H13
MFLLFKYLPKDVLNGLLTVYFVFLGAMAICATFTPLFAKIMPKRVALTRIYFGTIPTIKYINEEGPYEVSFDVAELTTGAAAIAFCKWYYDTKHFLANNVLGLSFALQGIEFLTLDSIQIGVILLVGLFFYDIFWVFFTPVMVSVAKSFDAPIKLLFPRGPVNVLDSSKRPFSMLGLGDIVIPGLYLALILRMDMQRKEAANRPRTRSKARELKKKPPPMYFWAVALGYALGLVTTIAVMNIFEAAQPALLYIVPGLLLTTFIRAVFAGEVRKVFYFDEKVGSVSGEIAVESSQHED